MRPTVDWSLYLVTDRALAGGRPIEWVVQQAVEGGVSVVQLREKACPAGAMVELARRLKALLSPRGVPLIVNDHPEVALAAGADGVHLGQRDAAPADARRLLGPDALIGLSVETPEQAAAAEALDVDYLGVSPVFSTPTKPDTEREWRLEGLRRLRSVSHHTLIAIGGIQESNAADVVGAGADGIAVVSAICAAEDPREAARRLRRIVEEARGSGR